MFISVSSQTTLHDSANFLSFSLADASAPNVILEVITPSKPYGNPMQVSFLYNCINQHIYNIKIWESPSGGATGEVRNNWSQGINGQSVLTRPPEYLQVGVTPGLAVNGTDYDDVTWLNWDYVFWRESELMIPDKTDNNDPNYHQKNTGGLALIRVGDKWNRNEHIVILFEAQVVTASEGTPSNAFGEGRIITTNIDLTVDDVNQALTFQAAANNIIAKMPSIASIQNYTQWFYFFSQGGNHKNARFQANTGDKFLYNGDKDILILGQCENMFVFKAPTGPSGASRWNIFNDLYGVRSVGELLYSYSNTGINTIPMDGSLISRTVYARLWAWVQTQPITVSEATWASFPSPVDGVTVYPNKGFFTPGDGSTTFRLPLMTDIQLKGGTSPGAHENWMSVAHDHSTPHANSGSGGGLGYVGGSLPFDDTANKTSPMRIVGSGGALLTAVGSKVKTESILAYACIRI